MWLAKSYKNCSRIFKEFYAQRVIVLDCIFEKHIGIPNLRLRLTLIIQSRKIVENIYFFIFKISEGIVLRKLYCVKMLSIVVNTKNSEGDLQERNYILFRKSDPLMINI